MSICKICGQATTDLFDPQLNINYDQCNDCGFIYKQPIYHVSLEEESSEYDRHNNSFESVGYVNMFEQFIEEFIRPLHLTGKALEFGSGPGPVLKELLTREGFETYDFDPFYNPNEEYVKHKYTLITSTEVVEHFQHPMKEFHHLRSLLDSNGYLIIMTNFNVFDNEGFIKWWYRRDITHISFYRLETLQYIAKQCGLDVINHNNKNVILFKAIE